MSLPTTKTKPIQNEFVEDQVSIKQKRKLKHMLLSSILRIICPMIFYFINSKWFLFISRHLLRLLNPNRDVRVVVRGLTMYANTLDRILALLFWKYRLVEGYEADLMGTLIKKGMTVVNCGANLGYYTLQMARWVGEQGHVYAFEPDPNSFRLLTKNNKANGFKNLTLIQKAISDRAQKCFLFFCEENRGDHQIFDDGTNRQKVLIDSISLDQFFTEGQQIDLVKMDIQGAEMHALKGMKKIFASNPNIVVFSEFCPTLIERAGFSAIEFLNEIDMLGFETFLVDEDNHCIKKVSKETLLSLCKKQYYCSIIMKCPD